MISERETERASAVENYRQGDILQFEYPVDMEGSRLGVVINADCDLENKKTDGVIAYLPMYSFHEYLEIFWAPKYIKNISTETGQRLVEITQAGSTGLSDLAQLMALMEPDAVAAQLLTLQSIKSKDRALIPDLVAKLATCARNDISAYAKFSSLCRLQKDPAKHAKTQIEAAKKELSDGHFFVSELVEQDEIGFVIRMRRIYSLSEDRIFRTIADQRARSDGNSLTGARIARLIPPFSLQGFTTVRTAVFSDRSA